MPIFLPILQFVLGVLGLLAGRHSTFIPPRRTWLVSAALVTLSLLVCVCTIYQGYRSDQQSRRNQTLLSNLAGSGSFPVVIPQSDAESAPLIAWNFGDDMLSGLTVEISCGNLHGARKETIETLPGHSPAQLYTAFNPNACRDQIALTYKGAATTYYDIEMRTQRGAFTEILEFRRAEKCSRWATRYSIIMHVGGFLQNHQPGQVGEEARSYNAPSSFGRWNEPACP
jgi:hypothetical protein